MPNNIGHGVGEWVDEATLVEHYRATSIKYQKSQQYSTGQPMSRNHHSTNHRHYPDFKHAGGPTSQGPEARTNGIVPGYAGHVPRAIHKHSSPASGGLMMPPELKSHPRNLAPPAQGNRPTEDKKALMASPDPMQDSWGTVRNNAYPKPRPGYAGHVPAARDTWGVSYHR